MLLASVDVTPSVSTVTTSFASGWLSEWAEPGKGKNVRLNFEISKADATSIEIRLEFDDDRDSGGYEVWSYSPDAVANTDSLPLYAKRWVITASELPTDGRVTFRYHGRLARRLRLKAKKSGGSGTVTMSASVVVDRS